MRIFDSHLHIIAPGYPQPRNQGYLAPEFSSAEYRHRVRGLNVVGGAVVAGSFQGFDATFLVAALQAMGPTYVGVAQLPDDTPDAEILRLHAAGVRALRFNFRRLGSFDPQTLEKLARRVYELAGWHVELYVESRDLGELETLLRRLPRICIDHLGLTRSGFDRLRALVDQGAWVKASGFGRGDLPVQWAIRELIAVNPDALMFATDLPSTRSPRPFSFADVQLVLDILDGEQRDKVLYRNAIELYRPTEIC